VYLIGSHARNQPHRAGDIDILIVTDKPLSEEEKIRVTKHVEEELGLPPSHPVHLHNVTRRDLKRIREEKKRLA
jgi:predicted nucleotidyltransferase